MAKSPITPQVLAILQGLIKANSGKPQQYLKSITKNEDAKTITIKDENDTETTFEYGADLPFLSCERLGAYLFKITFDDVPEYVPTDNFAIGGCSAFVRGGKMYRNFDLTYDEVAEFWVKTKEFEGIARIDGVDDGDLNFNLLGQTPYCLADGVNNSGIMVSEHVLFNDFGFAGTGTKENDMTLLPYTILKKAISINDLNTNAEISDFLANMNIPPALAEKGYILQYLVSDGSITFAITPKSDGSAYELVDISTLPKITNFKWLNKATLERNDSDLQTHPTGVERWNEIDADTTLADLRFTKCYESPTRLSEFIGESGTTKDSTDEELTAIYDTARAAYLTRTRNGQTWQTCHSIIYGDGIESLFVQENYEHDYIIHGGTEPEPAIIIEADSHTTIEGYAVPVLTDDQILSAYNGVVAGRNVFIVDDLGFITTQVLDASDIESEPSIRLIFTNVMILTYYTGGEIGAKLIGAPTEEFSPAEAFADGTALKISSVETNAKAIVIDGKWLELNTYFASSVPQATQGWTSAVKVNPSFKYKIDTTRQSRTLGSMWANGAYQNTAFSRLSSGDIGMYYYGDLLNQTGGVNVMLKIPVTLR